MLKRRPRLHLGLILLNFHQHASEVAMKANRVLACMRRGFINLNESILLQLYKSMVQPILEYGNILVQPILEYGNIR